MATQADIEAHYDVDNDFFALFLDKGYRAYTCAVWDNAKTLEEAQVDKFKRLCRYANVQDGYKVLDVGCGWGGLMSFMADEYPNAQIHGLTLSTKQVEHINGTKNKNVSAELLSWEHYPVPAQKFDSVICVGGMEHFATQEDSVSGRQRDIYKKFFDWCLSVSTPNAQVGIHTIVITRPPNNITELKDSKYLQEKVFPGSALACISDIQSAVVDKYEISAVSRIGMDYVRTLAEWKMRLIQNKDIVVERYGQSLFDHYTVYFDSASRCFETGYFDLYQVSLKRATSTRILPR